jgi:phosphotransferase system HPr (HPr) family protein
MSPVAEEEVEVSNTLGLHIKPSAMIAKASIRFRSYITVALGADVANARSPVSLTGLGAGIGDRLKIRAQGPDADDAVKAIASLFNDKFGEE